MQNIGFWLQALETVSMVATITNPAVIAFTSDIIDKVNIHA